jgi:subfamily B ATP-binding cassette protein MsbA
MTQDHPKGSGLSSPLMRRLVRGYLWPERRWILAALGCMLVVAASTAANAWLMKPIFDEVFIGKDRSWIWALPPVIILLALVKSAATYGQSIWLRDVGQRVVSRLQEELYAAMLKADMALFLREGPGMLLSRLTHDVVLLRESMAQLMTTMAKEALTLVFLLGVMLAQHPGLSTIALMVFPLALYPMWRLGKRMRKLARQTQEDQGELASRLEESFRAMVVIRAYGREEAEIQRTRQMIGQLFSRLAKAFRVRSASAPIMEALAGVAVAGVVGFGGWQVMAGHTTPGAFVSFITAMMLAYKPLKSLAGFNTQVQEAIAAATRVFSIIDAPVTVTNRPDARPLLITKGEIRIEDVKFAYAPDKHALKGASLTVPGGRKVALVGESGSGKSTLIALLLRLYDLSPSASSGRILIDGQDIHSVTLESLRSHIAIVTQDTVLFDDTVRANIAYARPDAKESEIIQAAKAAEAHDFISRLPEGYDTRIGPGGASLSGGQRQRLAIARAMLREAPILLLDEATSALDPVAEQAIQRALDRLMQGRTTLTVAHRLSTVVNADHIYVMKRGRVVEEGTHQSLLAKEGEYARLYRNLAP